MYKDKIKQREYCRKWVENRRKDFFKDKLCHACNYKKKLELHHLNPEEKISHKIWSWSKEKREEEIKKCVILCYDCHKVVTSMQRFMKVEHGGLTMYNKYKCRCAICKEAKSKQNAKRYNSQ